MDTIKTTLLKKLQHFCAYQDRCHYEVQKKLFSLSVDKETSEDIFLELINKGYLNEERYARSIARGKFRIHHWGKIKIIAHLKSRFISPPLIQLALSEIDEEEYHQQIDIQLKKIYTDKKDIHKTIQALITKGYESDLVFEKASGLGKTDDFRTQDVF